MSYLHCPYCEIKELNEVKTVFEPIQPVDGRCPDCGAYIDAGQHKVKVNSYAEIYKGALKLISGIVEQFNDILNYADIDLDDYFDDDHLEMCITATEIVDRLFVPNYGGTTKRNFVKAIGVVDHENTWIISKHEVEE